MFQIFKFNMHLRQVFFYLLILKKTSSSQHAYLPIMSEHIVNKLVNQQIQYIFFQPTFHAFKCVIQVFMISLYIGICMFQAYVDHMVTFDT